MKLTLSILTPAVPSRLAQLGDLCSEIQRQTGGNIPVEHLVLIDNKRRTVGEKRDALLRAARGHYITFVDDDDWISDDYVTSLLAGAIHRADVITFRQNSKVNDQESEVEFRLGNPNERFNDGGITKRNAWHVCAWRRELAILSSFPACNYGEDWAFAQRLCALKGITEFHIPKVLHYYRHDARTTEAPP